MRWYMIGLLVSLGVLLLAAAGLARSIREQRREKPEPHEPDAGQ